MRRETHFQNKYLKACMQPQYLQRYNQATTIQQRDSWSYQTKNDLKNTITSKVTLFLFTRVFLGTIMFSCFAVVLWVVL